MTKRKVLAPIALESQWEPSWEDAKTRVDVACEILTAPFVIVIDEQPVAYQDLDAFVLDRATDEKEAMAAIAWWDAHHQPVNNKIEALRVIYPYYHDGEKMPG